MSPLICLVISFLLGYFTLWFLKRRKQRLHRIAALLLAVGSIVFLSSWIYAHYEVWFFGQDYLRSHVWKCDPNITIASNPSRKFVISKYREEPAWLACSEFENVSSIVYDKYDSRAEHFLENIGYECTPYLTFILHNYDTLPDITYFIHANPFEHCPNFARAVSTADHYPFFMLSNNHQWFYTTGEPQHPPRRGFGKVLRRIWDEMEFGPFPANGGLYLNGQMAVHRDRIRSKPLSYYQKLWQAVIDNRSPDSFSWGQTGDGWLECVALEFIWPVIFGSPEDIIHYAYNISEPTC